MDVDSDFIDSSQDMIREFQWAVLFSQNVNEEAPFRYHSRTQLGKSGAEYLDSEFTDNFRKKKMRLAKFPGELLSFFCKIEKGRLLINL